MNKKSLSSAVLLSVLTVVAIGLPATAGTSVDRAVWRFDEVGSATAFDSSGNGNDGVNENVTGDGGSYSFNGIDSRVVAPSSASLNPDTADFSFSVTFTTTAPSPGDDYDLLRKGLAGTIGGEYKVEVINAQGMVRAWSGHCVS